MVWGETNLVYSYLITCLSVITKLCISAQRPWQYDSNYFFFSFFLYVVKVLLWSTVAVWNVTEGRTAVIVW
jgi:hypothetical protein